MARKKEQDKQSEQTEEEKVQSEFALLYRAVFERVQSSSTSERHTVLPLVPFPYSTDKNAEFEGTQPEDKTLEGKTQIAWEIFVGRPFPLIRKPVVFIGEEFDMKSRDGKFHPFHEQQLLIESDGRSVWYIEEYNGSWQRVDDLQARKNCLDSFRKAAAAAGVRIR